MNNTFIVFRVQRSGSNVRFAISGLTFFQSLSREAELRARSFTLYSSPVGVQPRKCNDVGPNGICGLNISWKFDLNPTQCDTKLQVLIDLHSNLIGFWNLLCYCPFNPEQLSFLIFWVDE